MNTYTSIPNWPHLRERYLACWRGEVADDAIIAHIQSHNPNPQVDRPRDIRQNAPKRFVGRVESCNMLASR